jgi:hypothetical protein
MPDIEDAAFCIAHAFAKARISPAALKAVADYTRKGASLKAVADYTRKHSTIFVVDGPNLLDRGGREGRSPKDDRVHSRQT